MPPGRERRAPAPEPRATQEPGLARLTGRFSRPRSGTRALTGRPPGTVVADRGFGTAANDRALEGLGVQRIGLQRAGKPGKARCEYERSRSFRRMRNWRVGIEARISHLKRDFGLRRTRLRRLEGAQTWTGLGIFAYNLQRMAAISR
jgi:IS5 family transposase